MALPRKLKYLNLFNDANSYQGVIEEITLPKLTRKLEAFRGGGMNGSANVDLGLDDGALDAEITLGGIEAQIYKQWGAPRLTASSCASLARSSVTTPQRSLPSR